MLFRSKLAQGAGLGKRIRRAAFRKHPRLWRDPKAAKSPAARVLEVLARTSVNRQGAIVAQDLKCLEPMPWIDDERFRMIAVEVIDVQRFRVGARSSPTIKLEVAPAMPGAGDDHISSRMPGNVADSPST